ncbi:MAG: aldo/keto reductase [Oscillospiraceae bacterium]|jgi:predicted aldo/keto reductase-like oxidoreductase|nr:aldo/keto reductase [Oscillospiraceae bacterium]
MEKRLHKKSGNEVSLLGFGCMRLPKLYPNQEEINRPEAQKLIDYAYENGVNYYDTAYVYHNGESEHFIGQALSKYPRQSWFLATKFPGWIKHGQNPAGAKEIFEQQLKNCGVEYFDYYLLHSINTRHEFDKWYVDGGVAEYFFKEKAAGRIKNLGFSFHGNSELMRYLAPLYPWDFSQIQLNYLDYKTDISKELYEILEANNIQCIIMEPVRGGTLATLTPQACEILKGANPTASIASWAIRFAASLPNVLTVLSGMSNMEQTADNVATLTDFAPLNKDEYAAIDRALEQYLKLEHIPCTACRYCNGCPQKIDIPAIFTAFNNGTAINKADAARCFKCGTCVPHCPQNINIPVQLERLSKM